MSGRTWRADEDRVLRESLATACHAGERFGVYRAIAKRLGRTVPSCRSRASKLGLKLYARSRRRRSWWWRMFRRG